LSLGLLGVVFYFVGRQVLRDLGELRSQHVEVSIGWGYAGLAALLLMASRVANSLNTWLLLKALGADLPAQKVVGAIWVSSLGRYLPGKVAVVASSMTMLTRMGARLPVVGAALLLSTGIMILLAMVASTPLFFSVHMRQALPSAPVFSALVVALGLMCLHPPIYLWLCNLALRAIKRDEVPRHVRAGAFWGAIGLGVARVFFVGMALWLAGRAVGPMELVWLPRAIASAALAAVAGFMAVFAPAGIGVHEAVYLLALRPLVGARVAVLVILFRLLQLIVDLVAAGIGGSIMRAERRAVKSGRDSAGAKDTAGAAAGPLEPGGL
jgi:hypothetical protein